MHSINIVRRWVGPLLSAAAILAAATGCSSPRPLSLGVMTDIQYALKAPTGNCYYAVSIDKLADCVHDLNQRKLSFAIELGDLVDGQPGDPEKTQIDLDSILLVYKTFESTKYHVIGDHCREPWLAAMGHPKTPKKFYYDFNVPDVKGWHFVVLDGSDAGEGVIGDEQLKWFKDALDQAKTNGERVICFCHFPLVPEASKTVHIMNPERVFEVMDANGSVFAWFSGHDHEGGYALRKGVHHVTLKAMVEGETDTAYAVVEEVTTGLKITGFGRETSRDLPFTPAQ